MLAQDQNILSQASLLSQPPPSFSLSLLPLISLSPALFPPLLSPFFLSLCCQVFFPPFLSFFFALYHYLSLLTAKETNIEFPFCSWRIRRLAFVLLKLWISMPVEIKKECMCVHQQVWRKSKPDWWCDMELKRQTRQQCLTAHITESLTSCFSRKQAGGKCWLVETNMETCWCTLVGKESIKWLYMYIYLYFIGSFFLLYVYVASSRQSLPIW